MKPSSSSLSPEWRLLIACARLHQSEGDIQTIALEFRNMNADRFVDLACQHDLAPLAYHSLHKVVSASTNTAALHSLKSLYFANAIRNAILFRELEVILRALKRTGTKIILLKGAALADMVYQNRALRPMSDVDLLFEKKDVHQVGEVLSQLGYALDARLLKGREWDHPDNYHLAYLKPAPASPTVCCETHWHLEPSSRFQIDIDGVLARAVPASFAGLNVHVLCPEDLLLYHCVHTCKHRLTGGFRAFCDIAEIIRRYGADMDWKQFLSRASEWRVGTFVYIPLRLASDFLGAPVPAEVFRSLASQEPESRLLDAAKAEVLEDRSSSILFPDLLALYRGATLKERWAVVRKVFSSASIKTRYSLPDEINTQRFYARRFKDLIADHGHELWRFFANRRTAMIRAESKLRLTRWLAPFA